MPIVANAMLDKYVAVDDELSLMDDHALALAHDLVMSAAAHGQNLLLPVSIFVYCESQLRWN